MEAQLKPDLRRWGALLALGCGLTATAGLHALLALQQVTVERPVAPARVAIRSAATAPAVPPRPVEVLPLKTLQPRKLPKAQVPPSPVAEQPPQPAEPVVSPPLAPSPSLDLLQPALPGPTVAPSTDLPRIGEPQPQERPPKPAEDAFVSQYTDAPGGSVVVLALLVNHEGEVVDTKLVVPSKYPLKDFGLTLASRQQRVTTLQPPLAPGEVRWVEVRLTYPEPGQSPQERLVP